MEQGRPAPNARLAGSWLSGLSETICFPSIMNTSGQNQTLSLALPLAVCPWRVPHHLWPQFPANGHLYLEGLLGRFYQ